jgi:hypothetical protein
LNLLNLIPKIFIEKLQQKKNVFVSKCFYLFICLKFDLDLCLKRSEEMRYDTVRIKKKLPYFTSNFNDFLDKAFFDLLKKKTFSILSELLPAIAAAFLIDSDLNVKYADEKISDCFNLEGVIKDVSKNLDLMKSPWKKFDTFLKKNNYKSPKYKYITINFFRSRNKNQFF